jgi:hypothetical protein
VEREDGRSMSAEDQIKIDQAKFARKVGAGVLVFLGSVTLLFLVPLSVFLTRIASGG